VRSAVDLGHNLGMTVVAEGVQDSIARSELTDMGCDLVQGYQICRPIPAKELEQWIETYLVTNSSPPPSVHGHEKVPGRGQVEVEVPVDGQLKSPSLVRRVGPERAVRAVTWPVSKLSGRSSGNSCSRRLSRACERWCGLVFLLVTCPTCGHGTLQLPMVRRRSTVRFRKGALGHGAFSSIQPGTLPSESATRVALMTPLRLAPSALFLEMEHCRASPAPGRGTRFALGTGIDHRPLSDLGCYAE
jgi:hypothetical protein